MELGTGPVFRLEEKLWRRRLCKFCKEDQDKMCVSREERMTRPPSMCVMDVKARTAWIFLGGCRFLEQAFMYVYQGSPAPYPEFSGIFKDPEAGAFSEASEASPVAVRLPFQGSYHNKANC